MKRMMSFLEFLQTTKYLVEWPDAIRYSFAYHPTAIREVNRAMVDDATRKRWDYIKAVAEERVNIMPVTQVKYASEWGVKYFKAKDARIFFVVDGNIIKVLSAFHKRRNDIPNREFEKAKERKESLGL